MQLDSVEIGKRIKEARKAAKMSQTELANAIGKTLRSVQKYESGEVVPSIAMVNEIAKTLKISPADLIGYQRPNIELNSISDVLTVLYQLSKKAELRFEIDVKRPPHHDEWTCSIRFDGNNSGAMHNNSLCMLLENFAKEREAVETYWHDPKTMDEWVERELAYYSDAKLTDKEVEVLTTTERIQRIMEADRRLTSQIRKDNDEDSQE